MEVEMAEIITQEDRVEPRGKETVEDPVSIWLSSQNYSSNVSSSSSACSSPGGNSSVIADPLGYLVSIATKHFEEIIKLKQELAKQRKRFKKERRRSFKIEYEYAKLKNEVEEQKPLMISRATETENDAAGIPTKLWEPRPQSLEEDSNDSVQFIEEIDPKLSDGPPLGNRTQSALSITNVPKSTKKLTKKVVSEPVTKEEKRFGCLICNGAFTRFQGLRRHLQSIHNEDPNEIPIGCPGCTMIFSTKQLKSHRVASHSLRVEIKRGFKKEQKRKTGNIRQSSSSPGSSAHFSRSKMSNDKIHNRNGPHCQVSFSSDNKYTQKTNLIKYADQLSHGNICKCLNSPKIFLEGSLVGINSKSAHKVDHHECRICGELLESRLDIIKHRFETHHVRK